jgi:hypothetical protein
MDRSAYVVRREGRYLFRTRWPRCLMPVLGSASDWCSGYAFESGTNTGRGGSGALPKLQEMVVWPVKDEEL